MAKKKSSIAVYVLILSLKYATTIFQKCGVAMYRLHFAQKFRPCPLDMQIVFLATCEASIVDLGMWSMLSVLIQVHMSLMFLLSLRYFGFNFFIVDSVNAHKVSRIYPHVLIT